MIFHLLMFPGIRSSPMVQSLAVEPSASGFQYRPLTVASRLLSPHITEEKIPRLVVKQLSTSRNTQRN